MKPEDYLKKPYARRLVPDEAGGFVATIQEFSGCIAEGDTADEALHNLEKSAVSWIAVALSLGQEIPEPISCHGYSGKIALRIPRALHKQVAEMAECEGTSQNQFLIAAIARYLGERDASKQLTKELIAEMRKAVAATGSDFVRLLTAEANTPVTGVAASALTSTISTTNTPISYKVQLTNTVKRSRAHE